MTLPSIDTLKTASFPATVSHAMDVFSHANNDAPLSDNVCSLLAALLSTPAGARGLFVAMLTNSTPLLPDGASTPAEGLLPLLIDVARDESGPNAEGGPPQARYVRELAVKNVVMPTAMVIIHKDAGREPEAAGSLATQTRAVQLVKSWHAAERNETLEHSLIEVAREMLDSLEGCGDVYESFVVKWKYDAEQRDAMATALKTAIGGDLST